MTDITESPTRQRKKIAAKRRQEPAGPTALVFALCDKRPGITAAQVAQELCDQVKPDTAKRLYYKWKKLYGQRGAPAAPKKAAAAPRKRAPREGSVTEQLNELFRALCSEDGTVDNKELVQRAVSAGFNRNSAAKRVHLWRKGV